jgi:hypothetical protein
MDAVTNVAITNAANIPAKACRGMANPSRMFLSFLTSLLAPVLLPGAAASRGVARAADRGRAVCDLDLEDFGQARSSRRRQLECTAARHTFEPSEFQQTIQNPSSDESLEVITTLAPVETRLAENPPGPRPQISAERGKETPARRRDLTAFIGEYDVSHRHECIGNSDSYLASQVIVATSGKMECIVVC